MIESKLLPVGLFWLLLLANPSVGRSQPLPPEPVRISDATVFLDPLLAFTLPDPRQQLNFSFVHQVTYDTGQTNLTLGVEVIGGGEAFGDLELQVEHMNFASVTPRSGGGSPGNYAGPKIFRATDGPQPVITNISNTEATANIRITVTLDSSYALSGQRDFTLRYHLF